MPEMTPEQQAEMQAFVAAGTPGEPHAFMAESVGEFSVVVKSWMEPGTPPMVSEGTATREMTLGGRVLVEEMSTSMMGMPYEGRGTQGFDNVSGKFWATWTDNMSTGLMVSEGSCGDDGTCTFMGGWNDPMTGKPTTARMVTRQTESGEVMEMFGPDREGNEMKMMEIIYTEK
ncbi:hypothetical protein ABI59_16150 [Acidobacteria bacterium Mor1]|nr:hypothetical protein ABI59_16150 [Acidobacteria bacterium Mor1]